MRIVRSPEIGVGEGTTPNFPKHLFDYLELSRKQFYALAQPTRTIGIRFLWRPRAEFHYGFGPALDFTLERPAAAELPCDEEFRCADLPTALMAHGKVFTRQPGGGGPDIQPRHGFTENRKLVEVLEMAARRVGVEFIDGKMSGVQRGPGGTAAVQLEEGREHDRWWRVADRHERGRARRADPCGEFHALPRLRRRRHVHLCRFLPGGATLWRRRDAADGVRFWATEYRRGRRGAEGRRGGEGS